MGPPMMNGFCDAHSQGNRHRERSSVKILPWRCKSYRCATRDQAPSGARYHFYLIDLFNVYELAMRMARALCDPDHPGPVGVLGFH